jgi:hypothetical protein
VFLIGLMEEQLMDRVQECQQSNILLVPNSNNSNNHSSMMYGSDLEVVCYIHKLRKKFGRNFKKYISALFVCAVIFKTATAMSKELNSCIISASQ